MPAEMRLNRKLMGIRERSIPIQLFSAQSAEMGLTRKLVGARNPDSAHRCNMLQDEIE